MRVITIGKRDLNLDQIETVEDVSGILRITFPSQVIRLTDPAEIKAFLKAWKPKKASDE